MVSEFRSAAPERPMNTSIRTPSARPCSKMLGVGSERAGRSRNRKFKPRSLASVRWLPRRISDHSRSRPEARRSGQQPSSKHPTKGEREKPRDEEGACNQRQGRVAMGIHPVQVCVPSQHGRLSECDGGQDVDSAQTSAVAAADAEAEQRCRAHGCNPDITENTMSAYATTPEEKQRRKGKGKTDGSDMEPDQHRNPVPVRTATDDRDQYGAEQED